MVTALGELEGLRDLLSRLVRDADNVREVTAASAELRQVLKQIAEIEAVLAIEEADRALAAEVDPAVIAAELLKELPALCRAQPEIAVSIRDELVRIVPFR